MGLYFRRSKKILPGVRLNFSKSGVGLSIGPRGAKFTLSSAGKVSVSTSIPGTGVGYRKFLGGKANRMTRPSALRTVLWIVIGILVAAMPVAGVVTGLLALTIAIVLSALNLRAARQKGDIESTLENEK